MPTQPDSDSSEQITCAYKGCSVSPWDGSADGFCLYHSPENGRDGETARVVWEMAHGRVEEGNCDFTGWHFPDCPADPQFRCTVFTSPASFANATFAGTVWFMEAKFEQAASFALTTFAGDAWFSRTEFKGEACDRNDSPMLLGDPTKR